MAGYRKMAEEFQRHTDEEEGGAADDKGKFNFNKGKGGFPNKGNPPPPPPGNGRAIPKGYTYERPALKPLAKILWSLSMALGHGLTAYRQFSRLKSSLVSPDGKLGGRGFVMSVPDVRSKMHEACDALSAVLDTVHDEVNAPHWKEQPSEPGDDEEVQKYVDEAEHALDNPEEVVEEEAEEVQAKPLKPHRRKPRPKKEPEPGASKMPDGGKADEQPQSMFRHQQRDAAQRQANSSIPVETLPGPRVDHLDRGTSLGPYGSWNDVADTGLVTDDWKATEGVRRSDEYDYPSPWEGESSDRAATSVVPDANLEPTPTEGYDFGIGYGAHGEGAGGYGELNPETGNKGTFGPASRLPNNPGGAMHGEESDTTPAIEVHNEGLGKWAAGAELPGDTEPPVARSDYYQGEKGNMVNVDVDRVGGGVWLSEERPTGDSVLPGDDTSISYSYDRGMPNPMLKYERKDNPFILWDPTTHNYRPDPGTRGEY